MNNNELLIRLRQVHAEFTTLAVELPRNAPPMAVFNLGASTAACRMAITALAEFIGVEDGT